MLPNTSCVVAVTLTVNLLTMVVILALDNFLTCRSNTSQSLPPVTSHAVFGLWLSGGGPLDGPDQLPNQSWRPDIESRVHCPVSSHRGTLRGRRYGRIHDSLVSKVSSPTQAIVWSGLDGRPAQLLLACRIVDEGSGLLL